jgi:ubiquinone/menaquinone biosynthesis C-methylase UbiE
LPSTYLIDAINHKAMLTPATISDYAGQDGLNPPERVLLARVSAEMKGQPILDIGVGGGRTTRHLLSISTDYTGIDYSDGMIAVCRRKFHGVKFLLMDARDMGAFAERSFGLVVFSCNGLGMVSHEDRLTILREVHRVLRPGGIFLFDSHNQRCAHHDAGMVFPELEVRLNASPAQLARRFARFAYDSVVRLRNYRRLSKQDVRLPEYSIINDRCHNYSVMLYYVNLQQQRAQLASIGFQRNAEAYDLDGNRIPDGGDTTDSSIMYLVRK